MQFASPWRGNNQLRYAFGRHFRTRHKRRRQMPRFDVTKLNVAIDRLLQTTTNPRHRFLLQAYSRHRYLEVAGRYGEIFAPDMMAMDPVYHFNQAGLEISLRGQDQVRSLYRMWAETNQSIFFVENEEVAVADHFVASVVTFYQQVSGKGLKESKLLSHLPGPVSHKMIVRALQAKGFKPNEDDMFLYKMPGMQMIWPYDDRGRLAGEDQWEPEPEQAEIFKLNPEDVLTTEQSGKLLAPFIKPLPSFDEVVLGKKPSVAA
jgi:hypothetical protein